jgi:hypothetical protein
MEYQLNIKKPGIMPGRETSDPGRAERLIYFTAFSGIVKQKGKL